MPKLNVLTVAVAAGAMVGGCVGNPVNSVYAPALERTAMANATLSPPAAVLAIGGSVQVNLAGKTYDGTPVTTFDSVLYQYQVMTDTGRVRYSSAGLITGLQSTGTTFVLLNAIGFKGKDIRGDQIVVQVTPTALPGPLNFSIKPVTPDSARLASGTIKTIVPVLQSAATGGTVANPAVKYTNFGSDSMRLAVYNGDVILNGYDARLRASQILVKSPRTVYTLQPNQVVAIDGQGTAWLYATVNAYGTVYRDSVMYTMTNPFGASISTVKANLTIGSPAAYTTWTLAPGATVTFFNNVAATDPLTMTYTFDNPAVAEAAIPPSTIGGATGNITTLTGTQSSKRRFTVPGTYKWTVTTAGGPDFWANKTLWGTIVIR